MAKKATYIPPEKWRQINRAINIVEAAPRNPKEGKRESRPNRYYAHFARTHAEIAYLSTGVLCSILGGHPSSAPTTGFGTIQVFGWMLGSTSTTIAASATIKAELIGGFWFATAEVCT